MYRSPGDRHVFILAAFPHSAEERRVQLVREIHRVVVTETGRQEAPPPPPGAALSRRPTLKSTTEPSQDTGSEPEPDQPGTGSETDVSRVRKSNKKQTIIQSLCLKKIQTKFLN